MLESYNIISKVTAQKFSLNIPGQTPIEFKRKNWTDVLKDEVIFGEIKKLLEKKLIITADSISENFVKEVEESEFSDVTL